MNGSCSCRVLNGARDNVELELWHFKDTTTSSNSCVLYKTYMYIQYIKQQQHTHSHSHTLIFTCAMHEPLFHTIKRIKCVCEMCTYTFSPYETRIS